VHPAILGQCRILPRHAVTSPLALALCIWQSSSTRPAQVPRRHATPRCSWGIRLVQVVREIPFSLSSASSRFAAGPGTRGLLYCWATRSQKSDGFRGLPDLLGSVGDHSKSESRHIHLRILFGGPIGHDARKLRHLGQPTAIVFPLKNYAKGFAIGRLRNCRHCISKHSMSRAYIRRDYLSLGASSQAYCGNRETASAEGITAAANPPALSHHAPENTWPVPDTSAPPPHTSHKPRCDRKHDPPASSATRRCRPPRQSPS